MVVPPQELPRHSDRSSIPGGRRSPQLLAGLRALDPPAPSLVRRVAAPAPRVGSRSLHLHAQVLTGSDAGDALGAERSRSRVATRQPVACLVRHWLLRPGGCSRPERARACGTNSSDSKDRLHVTIGGTRRNQKVDGLLDRREALRQAAARLLGGEAHRDEAVHCRRLSGDSSILALARGRSRSRGTTLGGIRRCRPAIPIWNRRHHGRARLPVRRYLRPRARWKRSAESYLLPPVPGVAARAGQRASRYCAAWYNAVA